MMRWNTKNINRRLSIFPSSEKNGSDSVVRLMGSGDSFNSLERELQKYGSFPFMVSWWDTDHLLSYTAIFVSSIVHTVR
jgi:hypothetical protein